MGNCGSWQRRRQRRSRQLAVDPPPVQPQSTENTYVYAEARPYPVRHLNSNTSSQYYPGYYAMPELPDPHVNYQNNNPLSYPGGSALLPYVEHQKALTIHNNVNVKRESLHMEPDEMNPGKSLVAFKFDATSAGRITIIFFAKEGADCNLMAMKESLIQPVSITFQQGLGQKFGQASGSGIDLSLFDETELIKEGDSEIYPVIVKAEEYAVDNGGSASNQNGNSQITFAVFEKKENGEYQVRVKKQILWVNGKRYELQEIYGIGDTVDSEGEGKGNETGKECIICLSEPCDTTVLPCRHLCMCSGCAKVLRFKTTRCPICRQPVEQLLELEGTNKSES